MARLRVPIIATVIGEGGSGGALALGVADRINMLAFSVYSVISPEGCASILWKDQKAIETAAKELRLPGARSLSEPRHLRSRDRRARRRRAPFSGDRRASNRRRDRDLALAEISGLSDEKRLEQACYAKFRAMGVFTEGSLIPGARRSLHFC